MRHFFFWTLLLVLFSGRESLAQENKIKIRWVLAHEPVGLFREAAAYFKKEISVRSEGQMEVEVLTLNEYAQKYKNAKKIEVSDFISHIQKGDIEMGQTYTTSLGKFNYSFYTFDLPFLFRDHTHARRVLEGKIGEQILASLSPSQLRGLAFTYSGGYRIIPGTRPIARMTDFKGLKIRTSESPIAQETFKLLGARALVIGLDDVESNLKNGNIEEAESTYPRYLQMGLSQTARVVNETNHSLFLTSIIMNDQFWNKLSDQHQIIIKNAALNAARMEREFSIKSIEKNKEECRQKGISIVALDDKEIEKLKTRLLPLYSKYSPLLGKKLIDDIKRE